MMNLHPKGSTEVLVIACVVILSFVAGLGVAVGAWAF